MAKEVTIWKLLKKLREDGYDLEIEAQAGSVRIAAVCEHLRVSRFIPADFTPSELAFIFWDISSSIKRPERKYAR